MTPPGAWTIAKSPSSARTASSSRSAGRDMRPSRWRRAWPCGPATTGFYPYYRDRALCLTLGVTPVRDAAAGRRRGGRSGLRRPPDALPLGHTARSTSSAALRPPARNSSRPSAAPEASRYGGRTGNEITLVTSGDGATSEGEFWESLNARLPQSPAAALPRSRITATPSPSRWNARPPAATSRAWSPAFPGLLSQEVDGTDFLASFRTCRGGRLVSAKAAVRRWCMPT